MSIVFARRKTLVCLVFTLNLFAARAVAIVASGPAPSSSTPLGAQPPVPLAQPSTPLEAQPPIPLAQRSAPLKAQPPDLHRPSALVPLYVSLASLQMADAATTLSALRNGTGVEANPFMRGVVDSPVGLLALKAGVTGLTILSSEKLWKKNRSAAILMMIGMNGAYAAIVAHNYSLAHGR